MRGRGRASHSHWWSSNKAESANPFAWDQQAYTRVQSVLIGLPWLVGGGRVIHPARDLREAMLPERAGSEPTDMLPIGNREGLAPSGVVLGQSPRRATEIGASFPNMLARDVNDGCTPPYRRLTGDATMFSTGRWPVAFLPWVARAQ